jgi:hypothetical protein
MQRMNDTSDSDESETTDQQTDSTNFEPGSSTHQKRSAKKRKRSSSQSKSQNLSQALLTIANEILSKTNTEMTPGKVTAGMKEEHDDDENGSDDQNKENSKEIRQLKKRKLELDIELSEMQLKRAKSATELVTSTP